MPQRFRDAHHAGVARVAEGGAHQVIGGPPVELVGLRADGTEFPMELTLGRWQDGSGLGFAGVVRDVSDRDSARRTLTTQYEVAAALAGSLDLEAAIVHALCAIGKGMGWRAGQLWIADERSGALRFRQAWTEDDDALAAFRTASAEAVFAPGGGLPGRVWESGRSAWVSDLPADDNFPRHDAAMRAGFRSGVAVPLVADGRSYGAVEFFGARTRTEDADELAAMEALGQQLGQFLRRREAEAELAGREQQAAHAAELNDEIVQGLVVAGYYLEAGRQEEGSAMVRQTLAAAKQMVSDLLAGSGVEAGELRRTRAARLPGGD